MPLAYGCIFPPPFSKEETGASDTSTALRHDSGGPSWSFPAVCSLGEGHEVKHQHHEWWLWLLYTWILNVLGCTLTWTAGRHPKTEPNRVSTSLGGTGKSEVFLVVAVSTKTVLISAGCTIRWVASSAENGTRVSHLYYQRHILGFSCIVFHGGEHTWRIW